MAFDETAGGGDADRQYRNAAIAYQNGPSAMIGAFDFAYIGIAVIWGLIFFAEMPDMISILGMLLIGGAGILSLRS